VAYHFSPIRLPLQIAPRFGVGSYGNFGPGLSAGVSVSFGYRHRGIVDLGYGGITTEDLWLHGSRVATRGIHGLSLGVGYELISGGGFVLRILIGSVVFDDRRIGETLVGSYVSSLALGYKFW
jgi:hypothetical protein